MTLQSVLSITCSSVVQQIKSDVTFSSVEIFQIIALSLSPYMYVGVIRRGLTRIEEVMSSQVQ